MPDSMHTSAERVNVQKVCMHAQEPVQLDMLSYNAAVGSSIPFGWYLFSEGCLVRFTLSVAVHHTSMPPGIICNNTEHCQGHIDKVCQDLTSMQKPSPVTTLTAHVLCAGSSGQPSQAPVGHRDPTGGRLKTLFVGSSKPLRMALSSRP